MSVQIIVKRQRFARLKIFENVSIYGRVVKYKYIYFPLISTKCYISFDWSRFLVSAEIPFMTLNLCRISAETKISDLSKISAEIWLRLETFCESGPWTTDDFIIGNTISMLFKIRG